MVAMKLLIATRNPDKLREIRAVFDLPGLTIVSALDYPDIPDVEEDGATLDENAVKKAVTLAQATGCTALADDTGLEVDALDGAPGVYSARFAGLQASYAENVEKLLTDLDGVTDRNARFRCVIALADPEGLVGTVEGRCKGLITESRRGEGGFGYDPVFVPEGHTHTFSEMSSDEKNTLSHRGRALEAAKIAWASKLLG